MRTRKIIVTAALVASIAACSRKKDPPPGQQATPEQPSADAASKTETIENGLLVIRTRYGSATRYTPAYAAQLVEEYDRLQRADPKIGPKQFWDKHGMKTVLEVEGTIRFVAESRDKDHRKRDYIVVQMQIQPAGWSAGEAKGGRSNIVHAQIATASQTARLPKQGQKVIVRGALGGYFGSDDQHPRGEPKLYLCQLVFPKDE